MDLDYSNSPPTSSFTLQAINSGYSPHPVSFLNEYSSFWSKFYLSFLSFTPDLITHPAQYAAFRLKYIRLFTPLYPAVFTPIPLFYHGLNVFLFTSLKPGIETQ